MIDDMSIKRTKPLFSLADQLFNEESVARLSRGLKKSHRRFDAKGFELQVLGRFPDLELKQRIAAMVDALEPRLPDDFGKAVGVLQKALPEPLDPDLRDNDFGEFIWGVPAEYVARHGVAKDRLEVSLPFLREATMRFTAENAIRPFLKTYPEQTLAFVHECASDENYHVRRLASEGIRPLLPWAPKVVLPTETILDVLDRLHADTTRYVTRSVANNVNDLSKSDPDLVLARLDNWAGAQEQDEKELGWMTRHGLRTLLKQGHAEALEFTGYPSKPEFSVSKVRVSESVAIGDKLRWQGVLTSKADQQLRIGLDIHFRKADGSHSARLFAVADVAMSRGEQLDIDKSIAFKPLSTRTLYPGLHHVALKVNGVERSRKSFYLVTG
jgi:3-methyladenine DNA glycosylase AlkC